MMRRILLILTMLSAFRFQADAQEMAKGLLMMEYHRYHSAENIFNHLFTNNRKDTLAAYWLGIVKIMSGEKTGAVDHFKKLQNSQSQLLKIGLADAYAANGSLDKATKLLSSFDVGMIGYNNVVIANAVGSAYLRLGDLENAEMFFKRSLDYGNENVKSYLLLGSIALGKMNGSEALAYYKEAINTDSNAATAYYGLAQYYISRKEPAKYLPLISKAIGKDSSFAPAWFELYRYAYYHDKSKVRKYYARYLELSDYTPSHGLQVLVMAFNEKSYSKVIELAKKQRLNEMGTIPLSYYRYTGISYYKLKEFSSAFKDISRYMELQEPSDISSYDVYLAAQFALALDKKDSIAISFISRAYQNDSLVQYRPQFATAMANYYLEKKDGFNATLWKERLLPHKNFAADEMYKVAESWHALGKEERADSLITAFCQRYPDASRGLYLKASIMARKTGSPVNEAAARYFASYVEKATGSGLFDNKNRLVQAYKYLGGYYLTIKEYPRALQSFRQLAKFSPNNKSLNKTIRELENIRKP